MKAITLTQPWASLMAIGAKQVETRSWPARSIRPGERVAIHAAKTWGYDEQHFATQESVRNALRAARQRGILVDGNGDTFNSIMALPRGCVVAVATFVRCMSADPYENPAIRDLSPEELAFGNYDDGRWAFVFKDTTPILPIPARGQLYFWDWTPPDTLTYLTPADTGVSVPTPAPSAVAQEQREPGLLGYKQWAIGAGMCRHFHGIQNPTCGAGVVLKEIRDSNAPTGELYPCFPTSPNPERCALRDAFTREEILQRDAEAQTVAEKFFTRLAAGVCTVCGGEVQKRQQVGRCVYAEPCGHRMYSGKA